MLTVQCFERAAVVVVSVGDEAVEAMAFQIGEGQLRAGVRALAAADQPGALRPAFEVEPAGPSPAPVALIAILVGRRAPRELFPARMGGR
jgi:hypothetical protein